MRMRGGLFTGSLRQPRMLPKSISKRDTPVFFKVCAMGGNMQGWRKDPVNNPPRIRIEFYEYKDGKFNSITTKSSIKR